MKKLFEKIIDITGKQKQYPADLKYQVLATTEDGHYFLYALYTKRDLTTPELIEISEQQYSKIDTENVLHISFPTAVILQGYFSFTHFKSNSEFATVEDMLQLTKLN